MNTFRRFVPALVLGLTLAIAGAGFAQDVTQSADGKKMESCCCCGDSCAMKSDKQNQMVAGKHESCCCGDSCAMKEGAGKDTKADGKHECCGDSCAMMKKDGMKNHVMSSDKGGCCGSSDSCDMKDGAKMDMSTMKHDANGKHAGCCGDSCKMKDMKDMKAKP